MKSFYIPNQYDNTLILLNELKDEYGRIGVCKGRENVEYLGLHDNETDCIEFFLHESLNNNNDSFYNDAEDRHLMEGCESDKYFPGSINVNNLILIGFLGDDEYLGLYLNTNDIYSVIYEVHAQGNNFWQTAANSIDEFNRRIEEILAFRI